MPRILDKLHEEHIQVSRLLDMMSAELDRLATDAGNDPETLTHIMHYMTHFPDLFHHPREDLLFERLVRRGAGTRDTVSLLVEQHQLLNRDGKTLLKASAARAAADELAEMGRAYVALHRGHMSIEEGQLFPLARVMLGPADWEAVDAAMSSVDDPVFGPGVSAQYEALRRALGR